MSYQIQYQVDPDPFKASLLNLYAEGATRSGNYITFNDQYGSRACIYDANHKLRISGNRITYENGNLSPVLGLIATLGIFILTHSLMCKT